METGLSQSESLSRLGSSARFPDEESCASLTVDPVCAQINSLCPRPLHDAPFSGVGTGSTSVNGETAACLEIASKVAPESMENPHRSLDYLSIMYSLRSGSADTSRLSINASSAIVPERKPFASTFSPQQICRTFPVGCASSLVSNFAHSDSCKRLPLSSARRSVCHVAVLQCVIIKFTSPRPDIWPFLIEHPNPSRM